MKSDSVVVRKSGIQGKGVFALEDIDEGEELFLFSDRVRNIDHPPGCHCLVCKRCIQISEFGWLYPRKNSPAWNLNHNCDANAAFGADRYIIAFRDIARGEEITIDYSTTTVDKDWKMDCFCSSSDCRKIIKSVQSMPLELFNRFRGYMPWYVEQHYT